jgi:hypothetical protein
LGYTVSQCQLFLRDVATRACATNFHDLLVCQFRGWVTLSKKLGPVFCPVPLILSCCRPAKMMRTDAASVTLAAPMRGFVIWRRRWPVNTLADNAVNVPRLWPSFYFCVPVSIPRKRPHHASPFVFCAKRRLNKFWGSSSRCSSAEGIIVF